ncbi:MAG TPA: hypothetical protein DEA30_04140 [Acholeplasmataceae bacterium]|nr:hypothetical protein [Acholeplasmataceae bacterium]HBO67335.1 hypothetical protein [Acholeplasmataceae bacterium]HBS01057.1 hypothetical protein [Acholeplasmataceae bacterium]HCB20505.1 hypothetical protein [Acholeplasmataceae bacterium]
MNKKTLIILSIFVLFLTTIVFIGINNSKDTSLFERHNLSNKSVEEIVSYLEQRLDEDDKFFAGIYGDKLVLGDDKEQIELALPNGLFYLSIAPYINQTHPCTNHNLVTCRGELKNQVFQIEIIDLETNTVISKRDISSSANGFAGIWLPANKNLSIKVTYNSLSTTTDISTYSTSNTCLTKMKLV